MDASQPDPSPSRSPDTDSRLRHLESRGFTPSEALGGSGPFGPWEPPTAEELQAQMPQYRVLDVLGHGGMGSVYQGWQVSLERYVAIKILPKNLEAGDANFAARFKQEAKTMARLVHPGIIAVIDAGESTGGLLYFVMEFIEGTDVARMLKQQGRLTADHALAIAAHVCDALDYAHEHGVIHRDIKPANVMLNRKGQVKVADFGLAKSIEHGATSGLTKSSTAMGTPDYIAPEALITGTSTDHRADLYAVGVMLYHMLTGKVPRGMFEMPSQRIGSDPRFDAIIARAMKEDREQRYQSAREIRRDLDVILGTSPQAPGPEPQPASGVPARKPEMEEPQPTSGDTPAAPPKKSCSGMIARVLGGAVAIGLGASFILQKPKAPPDFNPRSGAFQTAVKNHRDGGNNEVSKDGASAEEASTADGKAPLLPSAP